MKRLLIVYLIIITFGAAAGGELKAYQFYTNKGKKVDFKDIVKETEKKDFVFFGELHNCSIGHWLQLELTKAYYGIYKRKLKLGAEMMEADNQYIIDEYLKDQISDKSYHDEVRLWPNYSTDYQPLVEFAKANRLEFIATNIPRRYASMVYKKGLESLNDLSDEAKKFIVPLDEFEFDPTVECYKNLIMAPEHGGENMAIAQAIKDATMSYFILKNKQKDELFLHYNGAYHSDNFQGILVYLLKKVEREKVMTISTVLQEDINALEDDYLDQADFILCVPENMTTTY